MTRKHFVDLAFELRHVRPQPGPPGSETDLASDWHAGRVLGWENAVLAVAHSCAEFNSAFSSDRFLAAAGYHVKPDGSLYPPVVPR